jgi:hypothetical protein
VKISPYVGVTGIQSAEQARQVIALARQFDFGPGARHQLMLGILVSPATLTSATPINTTMPWRHVASLKELQDILRVTKSAGILGMLHMELGKQYPPQGQQAEAPIGLLQRLQREGLTPAIQLNGCILPDDIARIHQATAAPIVWQLRKSFIEAGQSAILEYARAVAKHVAMVLLDPSAGTGAALAVQQATEIHKSIERELPGVFSFGYAGGFGPDQATTSLIAQIARELGHVGFSVDVESRVRRAQESKIGAEELAGKSVDVLALEQLDGYFRAVIEGLKSAKT